MDPVSYLFSAYLNLVQQQVADIYGTEVKALVVQYEGEQVPFSYQLWQIKQNSVCRPYEQDVRRFSQCTVKAQALFDKLCDDLTRQDETLSGRIMGAAQRVLSSGYFVLGSEVESFEGLFARYCGVEHCVSTGNGTDALELADLFILKRYRRKGIGRAIATQVLCSGEADWLVRFYDQDEVSQAFWRTVLDNLPRPVQTLELDDDPQLTSYLITRASLH